VTNTVCILAAGRGTRMGPLSGLVNKAVLPICEKAAISWIIDSFRARLGVEAQFVVALGNGAADVTNYLALAYSDLKIKYVNVDPYEGPGSGPGASLLCCEPLLQRSFYVSCCDTLWTEEWTDPRESQNWLGVAHISEGSDQYCNVEIENSRVVAIQDKIHVSGLKFRAFTGLAHIHDFDAFFSGLRSEQKVLGEVQFSLGFAALLAKGELGCVEMKGWVDIGTHEKYSKALSLLEKGNFRKQGEFFYRVGDTVIKFFVDPVIVRNRVRRAALKPGVFPEVVGHRGRYFSYRYWEGETLYACKERGLFAKLLVWLDQHFWKVNPRVAGGNFYREKTLARIAQFEGDRPSGMKSLSVNGEALPLIETLLAGIDWENLERWVPTFIHGDLQFDNILYNTSSGEFVLIDWRQDFRGELEYGDFYYDLAKLYLGLQYNLSCFKTGDFDVALTEGNIRIRLPTSMHSVENLAALEQFIAHKGFDLRRVQDLASLALLSMSGLHQAPLADAFYHLGRLHLARGWR
jgi:NDP-sugar pyrophosphorylase family protein